MSDLKEAIKAIRAGDKTTGRQILTDLVKQNPRNENAWLWLANAVETRKQQKECLQKVLLINPSNSDARKALNVIIKKEAAKPNRFVTGAIITLSALALCAMFGVTAWLDSLPKTTPSQPTSAPAAQLPGLRASDITVSLEEQGIECSQAVPGDGYYRWGCSEKTGAYSLQVDVYASSLGTVDYISATVQDYGETDTPLAFLRFIASAPYDGARQTQAQAWVEQHFDGEGVERATFGPVQFELSGGNGQRVLTIGKWRW